VIFLYKIDGINIAIMRDFDTLSAVVGRQVTFDTWEIINVSTDFM